MMTGSAYLTSGELRARRVVRDVLGSDRREALRRAALVLLGIAIAATMIATTGCDDTWPIGTAEVEDVSAEG